KQPGFDRGWRAPVGGTAVGAPHSNADSNPLARGKRRERPGNVHRLVGFNPAGPAAGIPTITRRFELVRRLSPPSCRSLDNPRQPRAFSTDAERVAEILDADAG